MKLSFNLELQVSLRDWNILGNRFSKGGSVMSDDWANRTFKRLQEEESERKRAENLTLQQSGLISTHAPVVWEGLKEKIAADARSVNSMYPQGQVFFTVHEMDSVKSAYNNMLVSSPKGELKVTFEGDMPRILWKLTVREHPIIPAKIVDGIIYFEPDGVKVWLRRDDIQMSTEQAAEYLLDLLT